MKGGIWRGGSWGTHDIGAKRPPKHKDPISGSKAQSTGES